DLAAHAVVARGAGAHGPVDGAALADRGGPRGADLHEVVGEGARRAAAVAAVDDADVLGGQADAGVERLERRVVPLGDVAHEHLGDGVTVELQGRGAQLGDVVGDGDGARG